MNDFNLTRFNHSENIRLNSIPYVVLRVNGSSYINKRAASLLNLENNDIISLLHTPDRSKWFISRDQIGATVLKSNGLFRFCDTKAIKQIFTAFNFNGKKAFFPVSESVININGVNVLQIINKPFNEQF